MYHLKDPVRYHFQWQKAKSWLVPESNKKYDIKKIIIVLMCKKMFLFEKFDKNIQFNSRWCKAGDFFLSEDRKKLSVWSKVLFTVSPLETCEKMPV